MSEWQKRIRMYVVLGLSLIVVAGGIILWGRRPQPTPFVISTPVPTAIPTTTPPPTSAPLRVYISGAVHNADVYILPPGSIVKDAIAAAGGATTDADLDRINLALELHDQQQVYVPHKGEQALPVASPVQSLPALSGPVNINSASVEELDTLPGIGPAIAQRIVDYRTEHGPFATIEDIMNVSGIGPNTFAKLKDKITTE